MPTDDNTIKILLVVIGLPYVIVTIFLLLVCFRAIADKFANWSDVSGDYSYDYKRPDMERFQGAKDKVRLKRARSTKPVKPRDPIQPEQQDNQDQVFTKKVGGSIPESPLYFFETPGICQQTRFEVRDASDDSGRGIYGNRRSLSALEYLDTN